MRDNKIDSTSDFTSRGLGELKAWLEPWFLQGTGTSELEWEDVDSGATGLETTDGIIDVNPTRLLSIGTGITLTNPSTGEAHLVAAGGGSGGGSASYFAIDGFISSAPLFPHPQELVFTAGHVGDSHVVGTAFDFDATAGRIQITEPGCYIIQATVQTNIRSDSSGSAITEVYNVTLRESLSSTDIYSNGGGDTPMSAIAQQGKLPGSSGTPSLQSLFFFDVADDSGGGPYTFPLDVYFWFDWSASDHHDVSFFLSGTAVVTGTPAGGGGIQFDIDNEGGYLDITTNVTDGGSPHGFGMRLKDTVAGSNGGIQLIATGTGSQGIELTTTDADINIDTGNSDEIFVGAGGILQLEGGSDGSSAVNVVGNGTDGVFIQATTGDVELEASGDLIIVGLPTSDPSVTNAIWADNGVLVQSGHSVPSVGGAIFFNNQPQSGSWLQILTTGTIPSGSGTGYGIYMEAAGPATLAGQAGLNLYGGTNAPASIAVSDGVGGVFSLYIDPLLSGAGNPGFQISAGAGLTVPLLRIVRVGGTWSYHIKTGASWVADL